MRANFGTRDTYRGIFQFGVGTVPPVYAGCAIYDLGFDNTAVLDQGDGVNYKNMPNCIYQIGVPMVNFEAQRLYFNLGVNGQGILFRQLGFPATTTYSHGLHFRDIYCLNGAGTISCYNSGQVATAVMSDITIENIVNRCTIAGLNDDRICISGDNNAKSAVPEVETHQISIQNIFVDVTASASGLINGVKLDCGDGGYIHDVEIANIFYNSQTNITSNNPVLCELGPSASGTMQNISVDGVHAKNCNALIMRFWRNNDSGNVSPYMIVRNVHITNCQDTRVLEMNVANTPFTDEYITIENCVLHANGPSSAPGPVGVLLNVGADIQGVSGQTMIRNVTVRGSCLTGISNNMNENLQTIGSAWTNIIIENCELSSPVGLGGVALNMVNTYRVSGTRGVNPVNGVVTAIAGNHTASLDEVTIGTGSLWTWTLPNPVPQGKATLVNAGNGTLTATTAQGTLYALSGATGPETVPLGASMSFISDGTNWYETSLSITPTVGNPLSTIYNSTGTHAAANGETTVASGPGLWTWTLPNPAIHGYAALVNSSAGVVTAHSPSGVLYSTTGTTGDQAVATGVTASFVSDGTNWYESSQSNPPQATNPASTIYSSSGTRSALSGETTVASGAGLWTWTLPTPITHGYAALVNGATGPITVHTPSGSHYAVSGSTGNQTVGSGVTVGFVSDGTNWYQATVSNPSSLLVPTSVITNTYIASAGDLIPVDVSGGSVTITLPTTPIDKTKIAVKLVNLGHTTNTVSVNTGGNDVFNVVGGTKILTLSLANQGVTLQYTSSNSVWYVADSLNMNSLDSRYIPGSLMTAKGQIVAASGPGSITTLGVGSDGQVLTASSTQSSGLTWTTPSSAIILNALDNGLKGDGTTNDQPALQALVNSLGTSYASDGKPRIIFCPAATYAMHDNGTVWKSGVSLIGAGPAVTRFVLSNPVNTTNPTPLASYTSTFNGASTSSPLTDCTFANFEVDGSGVSLSSYNTGAKALVLQYMVRARFYNLYIHGCGATGLGCDFLQDSIIDSVVAVGNGRLNNGSQPGGAGIGIGIGGWSSVSNGVERTTIVNCTSRSNGTHGIFVELQNNTYTPPCGIRIIGCHVEANKHGISDWGADGLIISGCTILGNTADGFNVSGSGVAGIAGRGGMVSNCTIETNTLDGVLIGDTPGKYTIRGNRISNNGQHRGSFPAIPTQTATYVNTESVVDANDIYLNANCGIRVDNTFTDGFINNNRIRNNGTATSATTDLRAGVSFNQIMNTPTLQANRSWDNQSTKTQTYGVYATSSGTVNAPVMQNNNFNGNLTGAYSFNSTVSGGNLAFNLGMPSGVTSSAQTSVVDGAGLVNGALRYGGAIRSYTGSALSAGSSANTNGSAQTCSPAATQQGFILFSMIRAVFGGTFGSETATVTVTATFSDNSTASATMTATSASTQVLCFQRVVVTCERRSVCQKRTIPTTINNRELTSDHHSVIDRCPVLEW